MVVTMNRRESNCLALKPPISTSRYGIILFNRAGRCSANGKEPTHGP